MASKLLILHGKPKSFCFTVAQTLPLILSVTLPPSSRARLEKTNLSELATVEQAPEGLGSVVPAVGEVKISKWPDSASSTDIGDAVEALSVATGVSMGSSGDFMAVWTALVTAAVMVAVKASISKVELGCVAASGRTTLAVEVEGSERALLGRPREVLPDGRLREDIAFQKV